MRFLRKPKKLPKFDRMVILGHNLSGFHRQFILKYIYESDRFKNSTADNTETLQNSERTMKKKRRHEVLP